MRGLGPAVKSRTPMAIRFTGIRRVTHEEERKVEAEYWASRSIAERVIAGWVLAEDDLLTGEHDEPEKRTAWTLLRVPRGGG